MAITTYATLQSAITNWLGGRSDIAAARITECVSLFEASANRRLRVVQMEASATLATSGGAAALPTDFLAARTLTIANRSPLQLRSSIYLNALFPTYPSGMAQYFAVVGEFSGNVYVYPSEDASFFLSYFQKIPALSDSATTNWLLTAHPDLYLFGSLSELELFLGNDNRAPLWIQRRDAIYDEIEKLSNRQRYAPGTGAAVMMETP